MMRSRNHPIAAILMAVAILVAACGSTVVTNAPTQTATALVTPASSPSPTPVPTDTPTPTPAPTPTPVPTPVMVPDPMTGLMVTEAQASRHVVAVMIDDQADARPQSGLSDASIVWQAPAEGGIPRYVALFQAGNPAAVGPIRSSRLYFIAWAAEWNAVYLHVGGSPQAMALLKTAQGRGQVVWNADEFRWGGAYMWRIKERFAPHNVYTDVKHMQLLVKKVGAAFTMTYKPFWQFAPDAPLEQRPVGGAIVVPYPANLITYKYDRATNTYVRTVSVEGPQVDAGTKVRIAPKNVVVLAMSFAPLNDGSKKHRLEAQFVGTGTAWISTNGITVKGTWKKASITAPTLLFGPGGKPVTLTAGQTFVNVVGIGTAVKFTAGKPLAPPVASPSPSLAPSPTPSPS